jgi:nucleoside-diphosphate-sugar epimerase
MKSLVTGGTGFVGGYVAEVLLEEGHAVRVFTRRPGLPERLAAAEAYRGDLEEPSTVVNAMEGMDVVYHVGEVRNTSRAQSAKNLRLVQTIAEAAGEKGVKRLVFVSSITVAGIPTPRTSGRPKDSCPKARASSIPSSGPRRSTAPAPGS